MVKEKAAVADERTRRIGENEHLFRTVNDKLEGLNESFAVLSDEFTVVCECGDAMCVRRFPMSRDHYVALRADSTLFAIAPGHEAADVEDVVEKTADYWIVRKHRGAPAELATTLDE